MSLPQSIYVEKVHSEAIPHILKSFNPKDLSYAVNPMHSLLDSSNNHVIHLLGRHDVKGEIIGYCQAYLKTNPSVLWIQIFVIQGAYRRLGYGTYFYEKILKWLELNNPLTGVYLSCYDANTCGQRFWQHLGFKSVPNASKHLPHITIYYKSLKPSP